MHMAGLGIGFPKNSPLFDPFNLAVQKALDSGSIVNTPTCINCARQISNVRILTSRKRLALKLSVYVDDTYMVWKRWLQLIGRRLLLQIDRPCVHHMHSRE